MFWGAAALFFLTMGLFAYVVLRPASASRWSARSWIVYGGLVMPVVVLLALLTAALVQGERLIARPLAEAPLRVEARGHQWYWEFAYPDAPGVEATQDVLHIPAGEPVDVVVTTLDVIHSFWVPRLGGKIDAIPGRRNVVRLTADRPGTYRGICAEFCGTGHSAMRFEVQAHAPEDYAAALAAEGVSQ